MTEGRCVYWRAKESRWRVHMRSHCSILENHFSVAEYGSKEKAHRAAIAWRDKVYASLPHRRIKLREKRNRSGKIGVFLACKTNPSGQQYWSWHASWRQNGQTHSRKFAVLKYGDTLARSLAVKLRDEQIAFQTKSKSPAQAG
jgi:hypothetical protein